MFMLFLFTSLLVTVFIAKEDRFLDTYISNAMITVPVFIIVMWPLSYVFDAMYYMENKTLGFVFIGMNVAITLYNGWEEAKCH